MAATNLIPSSSAPATNALRDIKPPIDIPTGQEWFWLALAGVALLALLWFAWRRWRRKAAATPPPEPIPPHIRARQRLQEALSLLHAPREFCIMVSDTVRWYLEERFALRAPERTTEEFLRELQSSPLLSGMQKRGLADFLERCDLVKFAKYEPGEPELMDLHGSATRLVEETRPPEPSTAAVGSASQAY